MDSKYNSPSDISSLVFITPEDKPDIRYPGMLIVTGTYTFYFHVLKNNSLILDVRRYYTWLE